MCLRGEAVVAVVQATNLWDGDDRSGRRHGPSHRRVLREAQVRAGVMVVGDVLLKDAAQSYLGEDDDVVEARAADGPDDTFGVRVLPR